MLELANWLATQPAAVATFLGTLVGSSVGLVALLLGALFNARLNRLRDDRLRAEEARSIRGALSGELEGLRDAFGRMADKLEKDAHEMSANGASFLVPNINSGIRVMPALLPKFGLLSADLVRGTLNVYVEIEQFRPNLVLLGGVLHSDDHAYRGFLQMSGVSAGNAAQMARNTAKKISAAIAVLNAE